MNFSKLTLTALVMAFMCFSAANAAVYTTEPTGVAGGDAAYGYDSDQVALNQGAVVYWYAHGYANAWAGYPGLWSDLEAKGLPLRKFFSPHTGQEINLDDGSLDFDGDMTYAVGSADVAVAVQTTAGVVTLPGVLEGQAKCGANGKCPVACNYAFCDITICGYDCWKCASDQDCVCTLMQWIMFKSFETYKCRYGTWPCDENVWMASGFAPIDRNWKERMREMDIEYVWGSCYLKKAKVKCCAPCVKCQTGCDKCGGKSCTSCDKCATKKCTSCVKGPAKCDKCSGKGCSKCVKCSTCGGKGCDKCGGSHAGHNH
jgi:hypothetical protein